jgi:hypothetical protein
MLLMRKEDENWQQIMGFIKVEVTAEGGYN